MTWFDWLIVIIPVVFVYCVGFYSRRYLKDVTAFLSAGRVCGRYVISMGNLAQGLSIIGLLAFVEIRCKTGFALGFWGCITAPLAVLLSLYGYCTYRFRQTKAQSIGEFIEVRYSRSLRIFSACLRSLSEILANMIMPALATRFFIYFLGLPDHINVCGFQISMFHTLMFFLLVIVIALICIGGSLSIVVTDTIQGFICYPLMVLFIIFLLYKFSWSSEILPVLSNRAPGESFLNPYEVQNLRDFNYFFLIVTVFDMFIQRLSWSGCGDGAARSAHEQKMADLLGSWRSAIGGVFYILLAICIIAFMNHEHFAPQAHNIRVELSNRITNDIVDDAQLRDNVVSNLSKMPVQSFNPNVDEPLSDKKNIDTRYLNNVHDSLKMKSETQGNTLFQQFRTLYHQQLLPVTFRKLLPPGMLGMFCLLMVLAMISTDDSRIFSSTVTISQDVILPFVKKELTPRQHMWLLRLVAIAVGIFFFLGSSFMAQLDYINLYVTLVCTMWTGGCGAMLIFGLYSRFGTTQGAWTGILTGVVLALAGVLVQRNWPDYVYPWLASHDLAVPVGNFIAMLSKPFEPIILWRMDPVKCPINSYEWYFITQIITVTLYIVVSRLTMKTPFNLDRMLHRGKYALAEPTVKASIWTWKNLYNKLVGITEEYSFWDKVIAWAYFGYSIVYRFLGSFIIVVIWNIFDPWPLEWWGLYFLIVSLIVPGVMAAITAVWFGICGTIDLRQMFRDLEKRVANPLDDGRVEGNMSLADKAIFEKIDQDSAKKEAEQPHS